MPSSTPYVRNSGVKLSDEIFLISPRSPESVLVPSKVVCTFILLLEASIPFSASLPNISYNGISCPVASFINDLKKFSSNAYALPPHREAPTRRYFPPRNGRASIPSVSKYCSVRTEICPPVPIFTSNVLFSLPLLPEYPYTFPALPYLHKFPAVL